MALGSNHTTTTTADKFIPEVWRDEIIKQYKNNLVMSELVKRMSHNKKPGDTFHIPKPVRGTVEQKTANTAVSPQGNTHNELTVNIDEHWDYAENIEDIAAMQSQYDIMSIITEDAGYQLAKKVDELIQQTARNWEATGTSNNDADFTGTNAITGDGSTWDDTANTNTGNGVALTDAGIRKAIRLLDEQDVPMDSRSMVIPPVEKENLLGLARFTEQAFTGEAGTSNAIRKGLFGELYGVDIYVTNGVQEVTANDDTTKYYAALLFNKEASVHVEQQSIRVQSDYQLDYLSNLLVADTIFGVSEYRDNAGVPIIVPQS